PETWHKLLYTDAPLNEDPQARRVIQHAYVAVTRARRYLGIYERSDAALPAWQSNPLRGHAERHSREALATCLLFAASRDAWAEEGHYFLQRGRFRQAAECFRRAGDSLNEQISLAAFHESIEEYDQAATMFLKLDQPLRAAPCLELCGRRQEAANAYLEARHW